MRKQIEIHKFTNTEDSEEEFELYKDTLENDENFEDEVAFGDLVS